MGMSGSGARSSPLPQALLVSTISQGPLERMKYTSEFDFTWTAAHM